LSYFAAPSYTPYSGTNYGNALPQFGLQRNSFNGPGYRDLDLTLSKAFGLPSNKILGENATLEFRFDAFNVFNNLNFNPTSISNNIGNYAGTPPQSNANFGLMQSALAGRVTTLGARFTF
jgi:hypothetical protein